MNILQIFSTFLGKDPRPTRFYRLLSSLGSVTLCSAPSNTRYSSRDIFYSLEKDATSLQYKIYRAAQLLLRRFEADLWTPSRLRLFHRLKGQNFSAIICHDALLLPLALAVRDARSDRKQPCPVIMDAREFYPRQFEQSFVWRTLLAGINDYVCRTYFPQADAVVTVSPGLAEGYRKEYGIRCTLLPSYAEYHDISPVIHHGGPIRCVHHGGAASGRKLERMIDAFQRLEGKASLDMMLVANEPRYLKELQRKAARSENIRIIPPVPMDKIVTTISSYDVGVFFLPDNTFNHRHCLPNKFFEYIQARLALAISPLPDMTAILQEHDLGVTAKGFTAQAFADCIASLTPEDIARFKQHAHGAAQSFCWEKNDQLLKEILFDLMGVST